MVIQISIQEKPAPYAWPWASSGSVCLLWIARGSQTTGQEGNFAGLQRF